MRMTAHFVQLRAMRNILIFSVDYFPYVGGAEIAVRETCKRIKGCHFVLITCWNNRSLPRHEIMDGMDIFRVGIGYRRIDKYILPITAFFAACRLHRTFRFAVAWAIMANTGAIAAFVFTRIYSNVGYLLTLQEGDSDEYYRRRTWFWAPLYHALHARADHIHVISKYLALRARRYGYAGPLSVIPNGIDPALFTTVDFSTKKPAHDGIKTIITASRLEEKNGIDILLRAYAILIKRGVTALQLVIIGSGTEEDRLRLLAKNLAIAHSVRFRGYLSQPEMASLLKEASVFARPSRSEGFGNSFIEAMACGIPVVGTPVGGIPDFLIDGKTGCMCKTEDPVSLADSIEKILSDKALYAQLVLGGLDTARGYEWPPLARKIASIIHSLGPVAKEDNGK